MYLCVCASISTPTKCVHELELYVTFNLPPNPLLHPENASSSSYSWRDWRLHWLSSQTHPLRSTRSAAEITILKERENNRTGPGPVAYTSNQPNLVWMQMIRQPDPDTQRWQRMAKYPGRIACAVMSGMDSVHR